MAGDDAKEYLFHEVSEGVFVRKCYGLEELASNMEEYCDGFTHLTTSAAAVLPSVTSHEELGRCVRAAWTSLRRLTPGMACKTFRLPEGDKRFAFRYTVPRSEEDLQAWISETVFFSESGKDESLYEKNRKLKDNCWWRCSDDHYAAELHISPIETGWAFSLIFSHNCVDGRNSFALLDLFLEFLKQQLETKKTSAPGIEWGSEAVRLPPPGSFTMALAETGLPPNISPATPQSENSRKTNPQAIVPWLFAPRQTGMTGDVSLLIQLPEETTRRLHSLCKEHNRTVTQVVTALSALAHTEAVLKNACNVSEHRFKEVFDAFATSSHYLVAWNFINHRHKLPGGYDSYKSEASAPLCTADGVPLFLSMDAIRTFFKVDHENQTTYRASDKEAFWNTLVREVADAWKSTDQSLDAYAARELVNHHAFDAFSPTMFHVPALIVSSIGDLGRLNLLSAFRPQVENESKQALVVNEVVCGIRFRTPPIMNLLWEYCDRLSCHFMSGGEYTTTEELAVVAQLFEEWTSMYIH